ncbi:MAG TPA: hypothetical protein VG096_24110 [Bryobacteraceae bacterium]|nr:hypothetical protein [Bryobacteraceae bacterium]
MDNVVEVGIRATDTSATGALGETAAAVEKLISSVQLGQGDLLILKTVLLDDAAAGISMADALKNLVESVDTVGPAVSGAAASLLEVHESLNEIPPEVEEAESWFRRLALGAKESFTEIKASATEGAESLGVFAERARFSANGVTSSFSILNGVVGDVVLVTLGLEALNKFKETEMELGHLAEATGVEADKIVELKGAFTDLTGKGDMVDSILMRLSRSMYRASTESPQAVKAFESLGVSTTGWAKEMPAADQILLQIADHLHASGDATRDLGAVQMILRGASAETIATLKEGSSVLREHMRGYESLARAEADAIPAAQQLTLEEAAISREFTQLLADVFPGVVTGFKVIDTTLRTTVAGVKQLVDVTIGFGLVASEVVTSAASAFLDLSEYRFVQAITDIKTGATGVELAWKHTLDEMRTDAIANYLDIEKIWSTPPAEPKPGKGKGGEEEGNDNKVREAQIDGAMKHQQRLAAIETEGIEARARLNGAFGDEQVAELTALAAHELAMERGLLADKIALAREDPKHPEKVQALLNEDQALQDRYAESVQKLEAKGAEAKKKTADEIVKTAQEMNAKVLEEDQKRSAGQAKLDAEDLKRTAEAELKAYETSLKVTQITEDGEMTHAKRMLDIEKGRLDEDVAAGRINAEQRIKQLADIEQKEFELQMTAASKKSLGAIQSGDLEEQARAFNEIDRLWDEHAKAMAKSSTDLAKAMNEPITHAIQQMGSQMQSTVNGMITGQTTVVGGFQKLAGTMLMDVVGAIEQVLVKDLETIAMREAAHLGLGAVLQALDLETATSAAVTGAAERTTEVAGAAAVGAANAYAATAAIPIVGPEIAPGVAAATLAAIMAFAPAASAAGGFDVGSSPVITQLHPEEMVLPQRYADVVRRAGDGGGGQSGHTFNQYFNGYSPKDSHMLAGDMMGGVNKALRMSNMMAA